MHDCPLVRKSPRWIAIWSGATLNSLILETCFWEMWRGLMPSFSCWRSWGTWAIRNESDPFQFCDHVNFSFHDYLLGLFLGLFFFKVISHTVPDSATIVAIPGESEMSSSGILLSQVSVLFSPLRGHSERFHSSKGHHSVHYVLDASFILSWRSLFIEAKLALRMETNGKRMCIWIHIVLFMPMGPWHGARIRVFYLFIYLF